MLQVLRDLHGGVHRRIELAGATLRPRKKPTILLAARPKASRHSCCCTLMPHLFDYVARRSFLRVECYCPHRVAKRRRLISKIPAHCGG